MNKARPFYETSYKLEVAKMVVDQGLTLTQVCKDLSISPSALARWVRQYRAETRGESGIGNPITAEQQRIRVLEIEVRQLREDNALLKKATRSKSIPVSHCCQLIGLSPSSYYAITGQQALPPKVDALPLALKAAFIASGQTDGSRRLVRVLNQQGVTVGRYRVRSMMKASALNPVWKRKFVRSTDSRHTGRITPNLLHQNFNVSAPNRVWVADITPYRSTGQALYSDPKWLAVLGGGNGFIFT